MSDTTVYDIRSPMISFYINAFTYYLRLALAFTLITIIAGSILVLGCGAAVTSVYWVIEEPNLKHVAIALFYVPFVSWLYWLILPEILLPGFKPDDFRVRIVPYFEKAITPTSAGRNHPFFHGRQIAKNLRELNRYATAAGACPISAFGFKDDKFGQNIKWHDPNQGLFTVNKILNHLEEQSQSRKTHRRYADLIKELTLVREWLQMASDAHVRFAFVIRMDHEKELSWSHGRIGSFT